MLALDCASLGKMLVLLAFGRNRYGRIPDRDSSSGSNGIAGRESDKRRDVRPAHSDQDDDAQRLRGIVALPHQRQVLFTDEVELDAGKLPRWQPRINVAKRRLTDDDDE